MRKLTFYAIMIVMMFATTTTLRAENEKAPDAKEPTEITDAQTQVLVDRLHEIKAMDMKSLNAAQKKELRKEVREIKSELKANGVYISVGLLLVILLIVLLI